MPEALLTALRAMLPPGAGAGWADPRGDYPLLPGEVLPGARPARLAEFAAGRHAARVALRGIGLRAVPIVHGADRAPVWPEGVVGSITHTADACLAVTLRAGPVRGIGIDLEPAMPLDRDLWDTILVPRERAALIRLDEPQRGLAATCIFCAKEAAYKAHYPATRALVGFEVMEVVVLGDQFTGTFLTAIPPLARGDTIRGRLARTDRHILALALL